MEVLTEWIRQIILVVMFTAMVGFLLPNNQFYKYANVLLGFIVVVTIVTPIISLMQYDFTTEVLKRTLESMPSEPVLGTDVMTTTNENILLRRYKDNIDQAILKSIQDFSSIKVAKVEAQIVEDSTSQDFGNLIGVEIVIRPKESHEKIVRKVDKIIIGDKSSKGGRAREAPESIDQKELDQLVGYIRDHWGLEEEKISLRWEG